MALTKIGLLVVFTIRMVNSAVHFDIETTNYMPRSQEPNPGPEMDTAYVPGICNENIWDKNSVIITNLARLQYYHLF